MSYTLTRSVSLFLACLSFSLISDLASDNILRLSDATVLFGTAPTGPIGTLRSAADPEVDVDEFESFFSSDFGLKLSIKF